MRLSEMNWFELVDKISKAETQEEINRFVLELTYRMYVPFEGDTFEELLVKNGYKIIEKTPDKKI